MEANDYRIELMAERSLRFGFERICQGNLGLLLVAVAISLILSLPADAVELLFYLLIAVLALPFSRGKSK